jgi:GNAT superfamily N-acetyltransferase
MIDIKEYESLARETKAYRDIEIEILKEAFASWEKEPDAPYTFLELRDGRVLAAFAAMCREANTDYTFTVQTICLAPPYLGKGVAEKLLSMIEEEALRLGISAILRFELSSEKRQAFSESSFDNSGYTLIGHIPSFYGPGNDYFMYAKHMHRKMPKGEKGEQ